MTARIFIGCVLLAACVLESVVAFTFMERHRKQVTRRLIEGMARDMAALVDLYEASSTQEDVSRLTHLGLNRFGLTLAVQPAGPLPAPRPKPFFDLLDRALANEISTHIRRPFWIDTVGQPRQVEVHIKLNQANLLFVAPRGYVYVSSSHVFLIWMIFSWVVLLTAGYLLWRPPAILRTR